MSSLPQKGNTQFVTEAIEALKDWRDGTELTVRSNPFDSLAKSMVGGYQFAIDKMEQAVKFRIPKEGDIITEMIGGKSVGAAVNDYLREYKLPFPIVTIECENNVTREHKDFVADNLEYKATIIIAWEDDSSVINPIFNIMILNKCRYSINSPYRWMLLPYIISIDYKDARADSSWSEFITPHPFHSSIPLNDFFNDSACEISSFTQFLIALSCKNVSLKKGFPPSITENKKRQKKGKAKLNQYYEILIESKFGEKNIKDLPSSSQIKSTGGTKATHLRRGHIRHYENKNIWVESTVVNAHKGAATPKSYKIK